MDSQEKITIHRIRKGDKKVFRKLFELYYQRLFLYAKSYLGDADEAEDLIQDLFVHLWEKKKDLVIFSSISSYLFRGVHNRCIQYLRHKKVASKYTEVHKFKLREAEILYNRANDFSFSEHQMKEIRELYDRTNDLLPEKTKEVFSLSREKAQSNKEIANTLGITIKTVEYHITKALQSFRIAFNEYFI